jgi:hypothetical protein
MCSSCTTLNIRPIPSSVRLGADWSNSVFVGTDVAERDLDDVLSLDVLSSAYSERRFNGHMGTSAVHLNILANTYHRGTWMGLILRVPLVAIFLSDLHPAYNGGALRMCYGVPFYFDTVHVHSRVHFRCGRRCYRILSVKLLAKVDVREHVKRT